MRITLIGYRGCGKSTLAPLLARRLQCEWVDADVVIEQRAGCSIKEIFAREGEGGFRQLETAVLGQIVSNQRYGRPDDYIVQYKARNEAIGAADVAKAAATLSPSSLTWVVVGDLSKVGDSVRALQLGEAVQLDADGNVKK